MDGRALSHKPVDSTAIVVVFQHFGGQVLGCAAKCGGGCAERDFFFAEAKVRNLNVAIAIEQQVLQLEVSVDDSTVV